MPKTKAVLLSELRGCRGDSAPRRTRTIAAFALALLTLTGCTSKSAQKLPSGEEPSQAISAVAEGSVAGRIAQAKERIASAHEIEAAREVLEEVIDDPAATPNERDEATLALSHALEREGDRQSAIGAVERMVKERGEEPGFRLAMAARTRIGELSRLPPQRFEAQMPIPALLREKVQGKQK